MVPSLVLIGAILVAVLAGFCGGLLWTARPFRSARSNYDSHFSASAVIERVNAESGNNCYLPDDPEWCDNGSAKSEPVPVAERTEHIFPVDIQLYGSTADSEPGLFRYNVPVPSPEHVPDVERTIELLVAGPLVSDARPGPRGPPTHEQSTGRHAFIESGRR